MVGQNFSQLGFILRFQQIFYSTFRQLIKSSICRMIKDFALAKTIT
jgi:hypothetical protein